MPTYDYRCRKCGHEFELFQAITAKPAKRCPKCGRNTAERMIGIGAGVIFKGSGFYETDYKRSAAGRPACEAGSGDKPESKSDSGKKPAGEACKSCSKAESCPSAKTDAK
jgi:putative FmdB family regulatory protein